MSKDKREAERAARRAKRLAERAEERAMRKERQAKRAAERAERLAERATHRSGRGQDQAQSLEDLVDKVAQKAGRWIDEQTKDVFDSPDDEREVDRARAQAEKARKEARRARQSADKSADKAGRAAEELSDCEDSIDADSDFKHIFEDAEQPSKRTRRHARRGRQKARSSGANHGFAWAYYDWPRQCRPSARRRKSAHIYRDRQRKKVCGVCAGLADYLGRPTWEIRLYAVLGLFFIPSITIPSYFITYFFMDDKPYYKRVTDRFDEDLDSWNSARDDSQSRKRKKSAARQADRSGSASEDNASEDNASEKEPAMNNVQAIKTAKRKFSDIEHRLRRMEGHVTSSSFELQREFRKISADN